MEVAQTMLVVGSQECDEGEFLQNGGRLYLDLILAAAAAADGGSRGRSVRGGAADGLHSASDDV